MDRRRWDFEHLEDKLLDSDSNVIPIQSALDDCNRGDEDDILSI